MIEPWPELTRGPVRPQSNVIPCPRMDRSRRCPQEMECSPWCFPEGYDGSATTSLINDKCPTPNSKPKAIFYSCPHWETPKASLSSFLPTLGSAFLLRMLLPHSTLRSVPVPLQTTPLSTSFRSSLRLLCFVAFPETCPSSEHLLGPSLLEEIQLIL